MKIFVIVRKVCESKKKLIQRIEIGDILTDIVGSELYTVIEKVQKL